MNGAKEARTSQTEGMSLAVVVVRERADIKDTTESNQQNAATTTIPTTLSYCDYCAATIVSLEISAFVAAGDKRS